MSDMSDEEFSLEELLKMNSVNLESPEGRDFLTRFIKFKPRANQEFFIKFFRKPKASVVVNPSQNQPAQINPNGIRYLCKNSLPRYSRQEFVVLSSDYLSYDVAKYFLEKMGIYERSRRGKILARAECIEKKVDGASDYFYSVADLQRTARLVR